MSNRPLMYLDWTDGAPSKVTQPPAQFLLEGWDPAQAPPAQYMNWVLWLTDQWIQYFDQILTSGVPDQVMRLLNGGIWSFNATSGVLAWSDDANVAIPSIPDSSNTISAGNVTLTDGQIAYVIVNTPVNSIGTTTIGTNVITSMNFTGNISIGMLITGLGLPVGATVLSKTVNSVTFSGGNATSSNTDVSYTFANNGPISMVVADNDTFTPQLDTILIARRQLKQVYVGINSSQMVLRDGEFKPLLGSGYFDIYSGPAGENLTAGQVVYISSGAPDSGRTAGAFYKLDASAAYASMRSTFAGVVITNVLAGSQAVVVYSGFFDKSGIASGVEYYADPTTPGGITSIPPSGVGERVVPIGFGSATDNLLISGNSSASTTVPAFLFFYEETLGFGPTSVFTLTQPAASAASTFVFVNGRYLPRANWTLIGQTLTITGGVDVAQEVAVQYILANQIYLSAKQELVLPYNGSNTEFTMSEIPANKAAMFVFQDGGYLTPDLWDFSVVAGIAHITLHTPLPTGEDLAVGWFIPVGGTVYDFLNLGTGIGVIDSILNGVIKVRSIKAGPGISVSNDGLGNIVITNTGGGGGSAGYIPQGSEGAPLIITPSGGITPTTYLLQTQYIKGVTSSGAQPVTANPQIAPGAFVGMRLSLTQVDGTDYLIFNDGNGLSLNGPWPSPSSVQYAKAEVEWTGLRWNECSRS